MKFTREAAMAMFACIASGAAAAAPGYHVWVDGRPVEVLEIPAPSMHHRQLPGDAERPYAAALFDAAGEVSVRVESDADLSATRILPLARGVVPQFDGPHALTFKATPPFTLSVEPEPRHGALIVSGRTPDPDPPREGDPGVTWIGPGRHHFDEPIELHSGETLYLATGAFVEGAVRGIGTNITVRGHGVLSGLCWPHWEGPAGHLLHFEGADIALRDFTVMGGWNWTLVLNNVDGASIDGVNILNGHVLNDDGIDVCRSRDVTIRNCFIRTQDDCIAAKFWCEGLTVENCALWTDVANIFRIGVECDEPPRRIAGISVRDVSILHQSVLKPGRLQNAVNIMASNGEMFEDFVFDGLRFDTPEAGDNLASVRTLVWRGKVYVHEQAGHVRNVTFRNVALPADAPPDANCVIFVKSHDAEHTVVNVANECDDPRIRIEREP